MVLYRALLQATNDLLATVATQTESEDNMLVDGDSSSGPPILSSSTSTEPLVPLVSWFDNLLDEEYTREHGRMKSVMTEAMCAAGEPSNLACDFCGADIFQSFFECTYCADDDDGVDLTPGDGLLLCPGCYVEGRNCSCGGMQPLQVRPFDVLIADRNRAADALRKAGIKGQDNRRPTKYVLHSIVLVRV